MTNDGPKKSGWEKADGVAQGVGKAIDGTALVFMKIWGLVLLFIGILILVLVFDKGWWAGLLVSAYGVYLLFPGSKLVIW